MSTHNKHVQVYFNGEIWKIVPKVSPNTHLICYTGADAYN